ncbi:MAG TPA: adenosylmethionine--8-amino-7-oxononanoate transaminase [Chryseolinea sp.]|nr:adenosylmethionine--8-amino-7-oxononanoate transaminase [Chryseolinea sp.]HPH46190.1 adenosylmethionine--8-amino-7-oxononanoate transaminase [Chryseolinea sp.]HPM30048.1 adenosylmethionine--8-amino-7-oxononanoate transaminase [Chryseolinea sp.]
MSDLHDIDKKLIWHPFTSLMSDVEPLLIQSAEGIYLTTDDGRKIIDAVSSWWVNLHGHSNPVIAKAIAEQALKLEHVIFAGFTHEPAITLAKNLISILPNNQSKIFFSDNGSTAVEVGLKMAYQFWYNQGIEKKKIIAIDGSYHGDTVGAMSVGERSPFTNAFSPLLFDVTFIDFPSADKEDQVVEQFKNIIQKQDVGFFIFEPLVQGAAGMRMYSPAVLDRLIQIAQENNIICVADEVFTGFGRTGKLFASHYLKNQPDIIAVSKGITGGTMALGVTSCSDKIVKAFESADVLKTFFHGHSYTANPIACAAANASFSLLISDDCQQRIERIASQHEHFKEKIKNHKVVKEARTLGTIIAIELITQAGTSYFNDIRKKIYPYFLERNILLRPLGNVIYILPPYVINEEELKEIYTCIEEFLATF